MNFSVLLPAYHKTKLRSRFPVIFSRQVVKEGKKKEELRRGGRGDGIDGNNEPKNGDVKQLECILLVDIAVIALFFPILFDGISIARLRMVAY